jgi:hypothetical protein
MRARNVSTRKSGRIAGRAPDRDPSVSYSGRRIPQGRTGEACGRAHQRHSTARLRSCSAVNDCRGSAPEPALPRKRDRRSAHRKMRSKFPLKIWLDTSGSTPSRRAQRHTHAMPDRPLYYGRPPSGWGEPRRRFVRNPVARGEIVNESGHFYLLRARYAACSIAECLLG